MIRMKWLAVVVVGVACLGGESARAGECSARTTSSEQWDAAQKIVHGARSVLLFCPPCGDRTPVPWWGTVSKTDLPYVYVGIGDDRFANVARMVGCATSGAAFIDAAGHRR